MVSRVNLFNMKQPPGVDVHTYAASLRGQANVCDFNVTVHCDGCDTDLSKNYGDTMIRDQVCRGMADVEIQKQVLGEADMELEPLLEFIANKERGVRSAQTVTDEVHGSRSDYQRSKDKNNPPAGLKCGNCGESGHGSRAPPNVRREQCPAFDKTCRKCDKTGHYAKLC